MGILAWLKQKFTIYDFAALALAIVFFIFHVATLQPHAFTPAIDLDAHRDYLIAYNILRYRDFPAVGPPMSFFGLTSNSPIYYYFLAFLLWLHDTFHFLQVVNILFQAANLIILYILGKKLFSAKTGLLATALVAVSATMFAVTAVFWQPYWMLPYSILAYYSYSKVIKKNRWDTYLRAWLLFGLPQFSMDRYMP